MDEDHASFLFSLDGFFPIRVHEHGEQRAIRTTRRFDHIRQVSLVVRLIHILEALPRKLLMLAEVEVAAIVDAFDFLQTERTAEVELDVECRARTSTATPSRSSARTNSAWAPAASAPPAPATPIRGRTRWPPAGRRWSPLAAARSTTPATRAAGNYVVIDGKGTHARLLYAHLAEPSPLLTGEPVRTGQPIGIVGDTGDATACHLHFEIWTAPGWYEGGSPIDPLPYLEKWDRYS